MEHESPAELFRETLTPLRERLRGAGPVADAVTRALFVPPAIQERVAVGDSLAPGVGADRPERRSVVTARVVVIVGACVELMNGTRHQTEFSARAGAVVRRVAEVARREVGRADRASQEGLTVRSNG